LKIRDRFESAGKNSMGAKKDVGNNVKWNRNNSLSDRLVKMDAESGKFGAVLYP